jgi:hypothetical protein
VLVLPVIDPGFKVQFPEGKSLKITVPVDNEQLGWVTELAVGVTGVTGCGLITTLADEGEVQPVALVTVNDLIPSVNPVTILVTPVPEIDPGFMVQFPKGKPLSSALPVATEHVGCVIVPVIGANGVSGCELIIMLVDAEEVHPAALVTV